MQSYEVHTEINAEPSAIWAILTDAEGYPSWDSGVSHLEGTIELGGKIKVYAEANPDRGFPSKVTELVPNQRMVWTGGMPLGLFKGVRSFTLSAVSDGSCKFHMREEFSGPMLKMIWSKMPDLQPAFDQFAAGLKQAAETA